MRFRSLLPLALAVAALAAPAQAQDSVNFHRVVSDSVSAPEPQGVLTLTNHSAYKEISISAAQASVSLPNVPKGDQSGPLGSTTLAGALAGMAMMGAVESEGGGRKTTLNQAYLFNGETYGPGRNVWVPDDFPQLDDDGHVIHEAGSAAERNAARARQAPFPAGTKIIDDSATVSGLSAEDLNGMTKDALAELAVEKNVTVTREDGSDGEPLKADYVAALSAPEEE